MIKRIDPVKHEHYWQYGWQDEATRNKYHIGPLLENAATCLKCGDYIRSNNRHDFKYCSCKNIGVDGGSWYSKRMGLGLRDHDSWVDHIVAYSDVEEGINE